MGQAQSGGGENDTTTATGVTTMTLPQQQQVHDPTDPTLPTSKVGSVSVDEKMRNQAKNSNVGFQRPSLAGPYNPEKIASTLMGSMDLRIQWKMAWLSVDDALSTLSAANKKVVIAKIRDAVLPHDNTLPEYTEHETDVIANVLELNAPSGVAAMFRSIHQARLRNYASNKSLGDVGSQIGVSGIALHGNNGPKNPFIKQLYSQFSQTAQTYGSDDRVRQAMMRPFENITPRARRLVQAQGAMAMMPDARKFIKMNPDGKSKIMGIMGQCGYDNIPENNNSLMRFQKNAKTLEDFLGTDGLRQYEFLMKSAEKNLPVDLFAD